MVSFQQILAICVVANVVVRGYVLIAADMDDFKNLANTFLSPDLANQLTGLVSKSSHRSLETRPIHGKVPEVPASKLGNISKDELFGAYRAPYDITKVTYNPNDFNRRYRTVKNANRYEPNEDNIVRQPHYTNAKIEQGFERDDLENFLQNSDDRSYKLFKYDNKKGNYGASKPKEEHNIFSEEKMETRGLFNKLIDKGVKDNNGMFKKLDYTETKLGDWHYIPESTHEPVKIKNVKSGYMFQLDKNNDGNTHDVNEKWKLDKPVLEKDNDMDTHDSWSDGGKIKTTRQSFVGFNNAVNHELYVRPKKKEQKEMQPYKHKEIQFEKSDSSVFLPPVSKYKSSSANKAKKQREYDTSNQDFLESHDNINQGNIKTQPKDINGSFESKMFGSENQFDDETNDNNRQTEQNVNFNEHILEPQLKDVNKNKSLRNKNYMHGVHKTGLKKQPSNIEKNSYKNEKTSYNLEPLDKDIDETKPRNKLMEDNDMFQKYELSYKSDVSHEKDKNENDDNAKDKDDHKIKPHKQLIEEHDVYEKYALSYKSDNSHETKVHNQQLHDSDMNTAVNKKYEDKNQNKKESYIIEPKDHRFHVNKPFKQSVEDDGVYDKHSLSNKSGTSHETTVYHQLHDSDGNLELKNKFKDTNLRDKKSYNAEPKDEYTEKRKPYEQSMEENSQNRYDIKQQTDYSNTRLELKNKFEDNNLNEKERYAINSKDKNTKREKLNKQSIEENDKHDKKSLSSSHESSQYHRITTTDGPEINNELNYNKRSTPKKHNQYESMSNEKLFPNNKQQPEKAPLSKNPKNLQFAAEDLKWLSESDSVDKKVVREPIKTNTGNERPFSNTKKRPEKAPKDNAEDHQFVTEESKKRPLPEESDESDVDAKKMVTGPIKAHSDYIINSDESIRKEGVSKAKADNLKDTAEGNTKPIKKFTMKGTDVPKRQFYTMSSPDYYHKLPKVVEKYDFGEPIPESDRIRNKVKHVRIEPAMINRKVRLTR